MSAGSGSAQIDGWVITSVPRGWFFVPGFGLRQDAPDPASNIHLAGDELLAGDRLGPYVEAQKAMLARKYDSLNLAGPQPTILFKDKAEEALLLLIRHEPLRGTTVMQLQNYVRIHKWIGVATLTTTESCVRQVRPTFEQFLASLEFAEPTLLKDLAQKHVPVTA